MVKCEECGKKLGILQGYRHLALRISFLVCGKSFDKVDRDTKRWSDFFILDTFNIDSSKIDLYESWNKSLSKESWLQKWFSNLWIKIENTTC